MENAMPIIISLLDNDLYKFTMQQAVLHQFPGVHSRFKFKCRNKDVKFTFSQFNQINLEIQNLCSLSFSENELNYLKSIYFLKSDYIDFLRIFKLQSKYVHLEYNPNTQEMRITIDGPWLHIILFEVPILAIVNEVYFNSSESYLKLHDEMDKGLEKLKNKITLITEYNMYDFKFVDFGTRRRFSFSWQKQVIQILKSQIPTHFIGTSNVYFAKEFDIKPIGTMAHEWIQAGQALTRISDSQKFMLQKWVDEYRGDLGIALSDTLGLDAFLRDFDSYFAKLYDGVRIDSGDPIECGMKVIEHYKKLNIDSKTKTIVFSDNLDIIDAEELRQIFQDKIKVSFGIGTKLMNDLVRTPLNIVIKMTNCNGQPVAKISDSSGKGMCEDPDYLKYIKSVFKIGDRK
jgi:nicotinate phosphoribosyltransferase